MADVRARLVQRKVGPELAVTGTEGTLEVNAAALSDGGILAITQTINPPHLELEAFVLRQGKWLFVKKLDEGKGRCHRSSLLALPGAEWLVAWDEERDGNYDIFSAGRRRGPPW